ncbi:MAG: PmoA family protein [Halobacteriaceae archaeon]
MSGDGSVVLDHRPDAERVDVTVGGDPFTTLRYGAAHTKPVLHPIRAPSGPAVTRGYPLDPQVGERVDHVHHVGSWLNYGHVNGHDLWNYAGDGPLADVEDGGVVRVDGVDVTGRGEVAGDGDVAAEGDATATGDAATVETTATWVTPEGEQLREETTYGFGTTGDADGSADATRTVDRTTTLTALDHDVELHDDKEGLFAVRVATGLEHETEGPTTRITSVDASATGEAAAESVAAVEAPEGDRPAGEYYTSAGARGEGAWGTRARWVRLAGEVSGEDVSLTVMDHPENPGHPAWWHARQYGLFAANPLAPSVFSGGEFEPLDFELPAGESTTFRFRVDVDDGEPSGQEIEERWRAWARE